MEHQLLPDPDQDLYQDQDPEQYLDPDPDPDPDQYPDQSPDLDQDLDQDLDPDQDLVLILFVWNISYNKTTSTHQTIQYSE